MTGHRVAVLFFGLSRNAALTGDSIVQNVFNHSGNQGLEFFVASSLNSVDRISNGRSGERNVRINKYDMDHMICDLNIYRNQNDNDIIHHYQIVIQKDDYHKNNHLSSKFLLHQLFSLRLGYNTLISGGFGEFSAFVFLRPDLLYVDPLEIGDFVRQHAAGKSVCLPSWHSWGGLNDRFAIASPAAAAAYATRLDVVNSYCQTMPLHPERLLAHALGEAGVTVTFTAARARRVRATGHVVEEDFTKGGKPRPREPAPP